MSTIPARSARTASGNTPTITARAAVGRSRMSRSAPISVGLTRRPRRQWSCEKAGRGETAMAIEGQYLGMGLRIDELDVENVEYFKHCAAHDFHLQACAAQCLKRSEEHTSELQSRFDLVCRLLLEKKKKRRRKKDRCIIATALT